MFGVYQLFKNIYSVNAIDQTKVNLFLFCFFRSTSDLEGFQNHILMYAGKRFSYKYKIYKTRAFLAALDYNFHNGREHARNKKGEKMYVILICIYFTVNHAHFSTYILLLLF